MTWVCGAHHVLGVEHLLGKLWYCESTILLGTTGREGRKANHKEVKTWEWNEIHRQFTKISIQLTRESQASGHTAHGCTHKVIQITIGWRCQLKGPEANVVQSFIVQQHALICIFYQLVEGQNSVVRFHNGI